MPLKSIYSLPILMILVYASQSDQQLTNSTTCELGNKSKSIDLPEYCHLVRYRQRVEQTISSPFLNYMLTAQDGIICENIFDENMLSGLSRAWNGCKWLPNTYTITISVKPSHRSPSKIINSSMGVFKLVNYVSNLKFLLKLKFLNFIGFDIDSFIYLNSQILIDEFFIDFKLFKNQRLINGCTHFLTTANSSTSGFIFRQPKSLRQYGDDIDGSFTDFSIAKPDNIYPICSWFFRHARLDQFKIRLMANSFYMSNSLKFADPTNQTNTTHDGFNCTIKKFYILESYGLDLDSQLLNSQMLTNTSFFDFNCDINSIEADVFKPPHFQSAYLFIEHKSFFSVNKKQGIDWIIAINSDIHVDIRNSQQLDAYHFRFTRIFLHNNRDFLYNEKENGRTFSDRDFCVYRNYPFDQLVVLKRLHTDNEILRKNTSVYSCTELWIVQFFRQVNDIIYFFDSLEFYRLSVANWSACEFDKRLELCNRKLFSSNNTTQLENSSLVKNSLSANRFSQFDFEIIFDFVLMILTILLSIVGIINNLNVIYVILNKKNKKTMRKKHYIYMCLHCAINASICLIQIVSLTSECQYPFGLFCSTVRAKIPIQYMKIVLGEYLDNVCRLLSNFAYLGFSLCRMFNVGKDHGQLIVFMNEVSIKKYMTLWLVVSAGFSVSKILQFDINRDMPNLAYPVLFSQNPNRLFWFQMAFYIVVNVFNTIYDLINYFLLVLVQLGLDVLLFKKLKGVIREKEAKLIEMKRNDKEIEKVCKENEESKRRVLFILIFSSAFNLTNKVPLMIASLNDLRIVIQKPFLGSGFYSYYIFDPIETSLSFRFICSIQKACLIFTRLGNCLFLISLVSVIYFLRAFDMNFRAAYREVYSRVKK